MNDTAGPRRCYLPGCKGHNPIEQEAARRDSQPDADEHERNSVLAAQARHGFVKPEEIDTEEAANRLLTRNQDAAVLAYRRLLQTLRNLYVPAGGRAQQLIDRALSDHSAAADDIRERVERPWRDNLIAEHKRVYQDGHRPGDHFDECDWCALIQGRGMAYPAVATQQPAEGGDSPPPGPWLDTASDAEQGDK